MKPKFQNRFASRSSSLALAAVPSSVSRPLLALVISMGFVGNAGAAATTRYWDTNGTTSGFGVGGPYDWVGTGGNKWNTSSTGGSGTVGGWVSGDSAYFNGSGISSVTVNSAVSAAAVHIGDAPGNGTNTSVFFSGSSTLSVAGYLGVGWQADATSGTHNYTASDTFIQTGGTISITANGMITGRFATTGSYYMSGGSLTTPNATNSIRLGNASTSATANLGNSSGVFVIDGGTVNAGASGTIFLGTSGQSGSVGSGVLSLNSGSLTAGTLTLSAANTTYTTGNVNLNGGTMTMSLVNTAASGSSIFNFNGGTLAPSAASSTFMGGLTGAYIYAGGAVIDTSSATGTTTISQNLLAASGGGSGLTMGALTPNSGHLGVGYKSAPTVAFGAPASGTDAATGYVVLNNDGTINKIVITSPGSGYSSSQSVSVTLSGGGSTTAATFANAAASADQTTGGLTKLGSNTLTLSGTNTYSGVTTLAGGTLNAATITNFGVSGSLGNRASDGTGNVGILFQGGTLQYTGSTAQSTNRGIRLSTTGGGGTIDASGSSPSATLSFTASSSADPFENSGTRTLTLTGSNTGDNTFAMAIGDAGGATSLVKNGTGTWVLTGTNSYTGTTSINNGTLKLGTSGSLAATSSLSLAASATFDPRTSDGTRSQTFADVTLAGGTITVGMSSGNVDAITATGATSVTGTNTFKLYGIANAGTYNLLSTAGITGGGSLTLDTTNLVLGFSSYSGAVSGNSYVLTVTGNPTPTTVYWLGGVSGTWNDASLAPTTSNWATDAAGSENAAQVPGSVSDVIIAATGSGNNATTLGADFTVKSLTFSSAGTFSVAGSNTLAVSGTNGNGNAVEIGDGTNPTNVTLSMTGSSWAGPTDIKAGGTLTVGNSNAVGSASGALIVDGTLNVDNNLSKGDLSGSGTITRSVAGTGTLAVGASASTTFGGPISDGSGVVALVKQGAGTLTLSNSNSYSGGTTIKNGTLNVNSATSLGNSSGALTFDSTGVSGGTTPTLQLGVTIASSTRNYTLTTDGQIDTNGYNLTNSGIISGGGGLTKIGSGTWTLTGANTYTGLTTVSAGTLAYGANDVISTGAVTVNGSTAILALGNYTDSVGTVTLDGGGSITGSSSSALTSTGTFEMKSGSVSAVLAGSVPLNKTTTGTVTLSGVNTYGGATTITQGTLQVGVAGAIPNGSGKGNVVFDTAANTAILDINGFDTTINGLSQTSASTTNKVVNNGSGAHTLTVGSNDATSTYAGIIANNTGGSGTLALTKTGAGSLTLSGANTYSGGTSLSAGTLILGTSTSTFGTGGLTLSGGALTAKAGLTIGNAISVTDSATTDVYTGTTGNITLTGTVTGKGTIRSNNSNSGTLMINGDISGFTGTFTYNDVTSGQNLRFTGAATNSQDGSQAKFNLSGSTAVPSSSGRQLGIGASGYTTFKMGELAGTGGYIFNLGFIETLSVGYLNTDSSFAGVIADNTTTNYTSFTKVGTGTLTLSGANTYTGTTSISGGTLKLGAAGALGNGTNNTSGVAVTGGAVLDLNGITPTAGGVALALNGTGISGGGALINSNGTAATYGGLLTLGSASSIIAATGNISLTNTGTITGATFGLTVGGAHNTSISGNIGTTSGTLTKQDAGTLTLTGTNTFTGATTVNAGTLALGASGSLASTSVSIAAGATLDTTAKTSYTSPASLTFGVDSSGTSGRINATGKTLVISGTAVTFHVTGTLTAPAYVLATYGSISGTATFSSATPPTGYTINYSYNSGTQIALVQNTGTPFSNWISTNYPGLTGANALPGADPDNDGQNNITEFALDGNPNSGAGNDKVASQVETVGTDKYLVLTIPVRSTSPFTTSGSELVSGPVDGVTYHIQGSIDLGTWTQTAAEVTPAIVLPGMPATPDTGWTYHTFRSPAPITTDPQQFLRAVIEAQP